MYVALPLSVLHIFWLEHDFIRTPVLYALVVGGLLALRLPLSGPLDGWAYGVIKAHTSGPIGTLHSAHPPNPVEATGFRWRDAGIGAAFTLFCILLAGVATYTLRRHRALAQRGARIQGL